MYQKARHARCFLPVLPDSYLTCGLLPFGASGNVKISGSGTRNNDGDAVDQGKKVG